MDNKRQYEVVFIVDPTADEEVSRLTEGFTQIVTDQGGVVTKADGYLNPATYVQGILGKFNNVKVTLQSVAVASPRK